MTSLIERLKSAEAAGEWKPHDYWPDYQAMGDCVTCGNRREDCERFNAEHANLSRAPADE